MNTCYNLADVADCDEFVCSACGIDLVEWARKIVDIDESDTTYHEYAFKFCPNCGRKVVSKDDSRC